MNASFDSRFKHFIKNLSGFSVPLSKSLLLKEEKMFKIFSDSITQLLQVNFYNLQELDKVLKWFKVERKNIDTLWHCSKPNRNKVASHRILQKITEDLVNLDNKRLAQKSELPHSNS